MECYLKPLLGTLEQRGAESEGGEKSERIMECSIFTWN
jgi:hypothetical protein